MPARDIYQLKVTLKNVRPPIWRRIQVPTEITLARLHRILQNALGWTDSHLHQFIVGRTYIGLPDPDAFHPVIDERKVRLSEIAQPKSRFQYEYDFGDGWTHDVLVEKTLPAESGVAYPRCIDGKRACPPEDCGGVWGYADFLDALADPKHEQHEDMKEWIGGDFDPEAFDLATTNALLRGSRGRAAGWTLRP